MKYAAIIITVSAVIFLCLLIVACQTIPLPVPGILVSADRSTLHAATCFRFQEKLYVLGGYHKKIIPEEYVIWALPFSSQSKGVQYSTKKIPNIRRFEITDAREALIIENTFVDNQDPAFVIQPQTWKDAGKIPVEEVIRGHQYYLEFKGNLYAVGGKDWSRDIEYADVWVTGDLKSWKRICEKAPWVQEGRSRIRHSLFIANDSIYLTGGQGRWLSGKSGHIEYDDTWKSQDGQHWIKVTETAGISKPGKVMKSGSRYFYIKDHKQLYVSEDGTRWQRMFYASANMDFLEGRITMIVANERHRYLEPHLKSQYGYDLYFSEDGIHWKSDQGKALSMIPRAKGQRDRNSYRAYPNYDRINYAVDGFDLVWFENTFWSIAMFEGRQAIHRSNNLKTWEKISNVYGYFPLRSDVSVAAFDGYLWVTGGAWLFDVEDVYEPAFSVFLTDVHRSKDGVKWEEMTNRVPWGTGGPANIFSARGHLYLLARGAYGTASQGVIREPFDIWRTKDGNNWERVTPETSDVHTQADDPDDIRCVIETDKALYFFDPAQYRSFIQQNKSETYIQASAIHEKFGVIKAILQGDEPPVFLRQGRDSKYFYRSYDLDGWEPVTWKTAKADSQQKGNRFPDDYEHMVYRPLVYDNRLFMVGRKPSGERLYAFEMLGDDDKKNAEALYQQGTLHYSGQMGPKDLGQAIKLWEKSAMLGHTEAMFAMGVMHDKGEGVPKNAAKAIQWWEKAGQQGHDKAIYNIGWKYFNGKDVPQDFVKAAQYYEKAANLGNVTAQYNIGAMYDRGRGVPRDAATAVKWYQKAAEKGFALAQNNLGVMHYEGDGVPKNLSTAVHWHQKAAAQGSASAQKNLGGMYARGEGVPKDPVIAYAWYKLAALQEEKGAEEALHSLSESMTPSQRDTALRMASKWKKGELISHD